MKSASARPMMNTPTRLTSNVPSGNARLEWVNLTLTHQKTTDIAYLLANVNVIN
ncbi:hypothetical protein [Sodalis sp.]|uniref:hypothetical protein n=1 Tax=Sodalis sp. (in: enterobacteria) TaxID=1898979 RepID=UPI003872D587